MSSLFRSHGVSRGGTGAERRGPPELHRRPCGLAGAPIGTRAAAIYVPGTVLPRLGRDALRVPDPEAWRLLHPAKSSELLAERSYCRPDGVPGASRCRLAKPAAGAAQSKSGLPDFDHSFESAPRSERLMSAPLDGQGDGLYSYCETNVKRQFLRHRRPSHFRHHRAAPPRERTRAALAARDPVIHVLICGRRNVDARVKPGHDEDEMRTGLLLRHYSNGTCWICGSSDRPSREHKFKASDLRRHFGRQEMIVHRHGDDISVARLAQGLKSSHLKFSSTICENCNSSVTQESDRAYEALISYIETCGAEDDAIAKAFSDPEFSKESNLYIPLFRYFAKLIGCHLADVGAPIPLHLSRFVAKKHSKNCIWLDVRKDLDYQRMTENFPGDVISYAAHGGLVIITKAPKLLPVRVHTTMTAGAIQFVFIYVFTIFEIWEMRLAHRHFIQQCANEARAAIDNPVPPEQLERIGLK